MGVVEHVGYDRFPKQSKYVGREVSVCFDYDTSRRIPGRIVRDDLSPPGIMVIDLIDARFVLGTECLYQILPLREVRDA